MALIKAAGNGAWNATGTWSGGVIPTVGDEVYLNGFTVSLTVSINVSLITSRANAGISAVAGGSINVTASGLTIRADLFSGGSQLVSVGATGANLSIIGNIESSDGAGTSACVAFSTTSASTFTITGNILARTTGIGVNASCSATLTTIIINGNIKGGTGANAIGLQAQAVANIQINGNISDGAGSNAYGVNLTATCPSLTVTGEISNVNTYALRVTVANANITVNGNLTGTAGLITNSAAMTVTSLTVTINGNVLGGSGANTYGFYSTSTTNLTVNGTVTAGGGVGAYGVYFTGIANLVANRLVAVGVVPAVFSSNTASTVKTNEFVCSVSGTPAVLMQGNKLYFGSGFKFVASVNGASTVELVEAGLGIGMPSIANVRSGVVYDSGTKTGTLAVPIASNVRTGVAFDNGTVGTADYDLASIVAALVTIDANVDSAIFKIDTIDADLGAINGKIDVIDSEVGVLGTKIDTIDANVDGLEVYSVDIVGKIDVVDANVDSAITKIDTIDGEIGSIASANGVIDTKLDAVSLSVVGLNSDLDTLNANLEVINTGVRKSSILVPHSNDVSPL